LGDMTRAALFNSLEDFEVFGVARPFPERPSQVWLPGSLLLPEPARFVFSAFFPFVSPAGFFEEACLLRPGFVLSVPGLPFVLWSFSVPRKLVV